MAQQNRPASNDKAPDPARSYERAKPDAEAGMGRMDSPASREPESGDKTTDAVANRQRARQINNGDVVNSTGGKPPTPGVRASNDETARGSSGSAEQTRRGSSGRTSNNIKNQTNPAGE